MARPAPYSYFDAGYNGFFRRTLVSSPNTSVLRNSSQPSGNRQLNFDDLQISGALGDTLRLGNIFLNGKEGRISLNDALGVEIIRIGSFDG